MKSIFYTALCITLLSFTSFAQTKEKDLSKAEEFSLKAGLLLEKSFIDIGTLKGVQVQVMKVKDLVAGTQVSSLRFEYEYKSSYSSDTKIAMLDSDEIEGLIKSMKLMETSVFTSTRETYTEVTFSSRTGFKAGCFWDTSKWKTFVKLEKFDSNSSVYLSAEDFGILLSLIEQGKAKL